MTDTVAVIIWLGVIAYAVFGGADYGAGFWDLFAGGGTEGARRRHRIDDSIGPVWEANHVWLIFVLVFLWTGFPSAFAAITTTLYIPLMLAAVGIVYRGGAFVFRKSSSTFAEARFYGVLFAGSSLITPFFLGAVAGAVASGRVPADGYGGAWTSWTGLISILGGLLAIGTCAWLASVFLASDARRAGADDLARWFGTRAVITGIAIGALSLAGIFVLRDDAPALADQLQGRGLVFVLLSAVGGIAAMVLVVRGRADLARVPAVIAVVAIVAGWGVGQYPYILEDQMTLDEGAAPSATMLALIVAFIAAALTVVPALAWLYFLTNRGGLGETSVDDSSDAVLARLEGVSSESSGT